LTVAGFPFGDEFLSAKSLVMRDERSAIGMISGGGLRGHWTRPRASVEKSTAAAAKTMAVGTGGLEGADRLKPRRRRVASLY
jgi:hypothetical protein